MLSRQRAGTWQTLRQGRWLLALQDTSKPSPVARACWHRYKATCQHPVKMLHLEGQLQVVPPFIKFTMTRGFSPACICPLCRANRPGTRDVSGTSSLDLSSC